jgi:hypothetical protein
MLSSQLRQQAEPLAKLVATKLEESRLSLLCCYLTSETETSEPSHVMGIVAMAAVFVLVLVVVKRGRSMMMKRASKKKEAMVTSPVATNPLKQ